MIDGSAQLGWSETQWNQVRETVAEEWQKVRVAGSFLPMYGPLPRSTQVVPSEIMQDDGTADDGATARLVEISRPVLLTAQQVAEEDLSSAILLFRRQSAILAQLEDWIVFNGYQPDEIYLPANEQAPALQGQSADELKKRMQDNVWAPSNLGATAAKIRTMIKGGDQPSVATWRSRLINQLCLTNPGALGFFGGAPAQAGIQAASSVGTRGIDADALINAIVDGITRLESRRYVAPFVCILGREPFRTAVKPIPRAGLIAPRDRIEPLIGRELVHAAAIDIAPFNRPELESIWAARGLVLSLAGDPVDLAIALQATPQFLAVNTEGHYEFRVVERFTLRLKDPNAVVPLDFSAPKQLQTYLSPPSLSPPAHGGR